jgi:hypothetical protein
MSSKIGKENFFPEQGEWHNSVSLPRKIFLLAEENFSPCRGKFFSLPRKIFLLAEENFSPC